MKKNTKIKPVPPIPRIGARENRQGTMFYDDENALVEAAALADGRSVASWLRKLALEAV